MFRIEMLPAAHGDCLWLEYGRSREIHRILIDGGPGHAYPALRERILHLPADERRFDLLVVTHIVIAFTSAANVFGTALQFMYCCCHYYCYCYYYF